MEKRIITWDKGSTPGSGKFSRAFIFGNYPDSFADYRELVDELKKDFPAIATDKEITLGKVTESRYMEDFIVASLLLPDNTTHPAYTQWERFDFRW